ncbi:YdcF family protein [Leptolyngbya sp. AN02str]|uniref:YdcF family protein n=1 Tax=Leptolyngbya sp. AN02str TaxID=3423363 RepID=UPI003D32039A
MNFLIGLAALWVFWLLLPKRSQNRLRLLFLAIIITVIWFSPLGLSFITWGLTTWLPPDSGEPVDAIVILGRGAHLRDLRVAETRQLWDANRAPTIFISGMLDARFMVKMLEETGVPSQSLSGEECSQSTAENALFSATILYPKGVRKLLLVTDTPHMLRALLSFRRFGFQAIPYPIPLSSSKSSIERTLILLREYAGLIMYAISGQFAPVSTQASQFPPQPVTTKIDDWNCYVSRS